MNRANIFVTTKKVVHKNLTVPMQLCKHPPCLGNFGWPVQPANCTDCAYESICRKEVIEKSIQVSKHVLYATVDFTVDRAALELNEKGRDAIHALCKEFGGKKYRMVVSKSGGYVTKIPKANAGIFAARLLSILCDSSNVNKLPLFCKHL